MFSNHGDGKGSGLFEYPRVVEQVLRVEVKVNGSSLQGWLGSSVVFVAMLFLSVTAVSAEVWWRSSINVESKVGTDRSIQSLDVMYPLSHRESSLTFTDLRGRVDDDQSVELNLGLAHRFVVSDPFRFHGLTRVDEAVVGFYGFFDRLESRFDNQFYQGTFGAEYFTRNTSLRVNGYLPENGREPVSGSTRTTLRMVGPQIFFEEVRSYERPLPGYDVELGRTVRFDGWQAYGRGSYFRFHHSDVTEVEGTRLRTGVQVPGSTFAPEWLDATQLTVGVEWQNDSVRDEQTFGMARLRVPFGTVGSRGLKVQSQETTENQKSKIENSSPSSTSQGSATSPARGEEQKNFSPSTGEKRKEGESDSRLQTHDSRLSSWQKDRLTERISRDVDIVTAESERGVPTGDTQPARLAATGRKVERLTG